MQAVYTAKGGGLTALLGVLDFGRIEFVYGSSQRLDAEVHFQCVREAPGQYFSGVPVYERLQAQESTPHLEVGSVGSSHVKPSIDALRPAMETTCSEPRRRAG